MVPFASVLLLFLQDDFFLRGVFSLFSFIADGAMFLALLAMYFGRSTPEAFEQMVQRWKAVSTPQQGSTQPYSGEEERLLSRFAG